MGSEFVIRLPVSSTQRAITNGKLLDGARDDQPTMVRRVLLVDDNIDAADLLAEALRSCGHEVVVANDPVEALDKARQSPPEIAILDIGLPVMDGYELAKQLRARPDLRGCRFIALTGYGQEHDKNRSRENDFANHFVKPVALEELVAAIGGAYRH
jgi:CheY-like chemotaxis protein